MQETPSAQSLYEELKEQRQPFLDKAYRAAALTIPTLLPRDGHSSGDTLPTPWSSTGARGVNNLASSLLLSLMPVNAPFFKLTVDDYELQQAMAASGVEGEEKTRSSAEIQASFDRVVDAVMVEIETTGVRTKIFEALKQLLVSGNVLLHVPEKGGVRVFLLDQYVVDRDSSGNVLCIVIKQSISPSMLPDDVRGLLEMESPTGFHRKKDIDLYTGIRRISPGDFGEGVRGSAGDFEVWQEVGTKRVPDSGGIYKGDRFPWLPLRLTDVANEDYGRGRVEEYEGALRTVEGLSEAIAKAGAASARLVGLVNPNGITSTKDLNKAPNGAFVPGKADDVSFLQVEKGHDMQTAFSLLQRVEDQLDHAFLNRTAIQRQGERVTATEIRYLAAQLEETLGGTFSLLAMEMQMPLVRVLMGQMEARGDLPKLPKEIKPSLVAGLDAIGKGQDSDRLDSLVEFAVALGPEALSVIHIPELIGRAAASRGIKTGGLVKTAEELQAEQAAAQQAAQQQALIEKGVGPAINQLGAAAQSQAQQT